MKWKKILKYILTILVILTVLFVFLANRDLKKIYGGLTQQVDHKQFTPRNGTIAINNVNILSPDGEKFISGQTVLIEDGLIVSIDSFPKNTQPDQTIDGEGKYLIPGLIDSHVHLFKSPNDLLLYVANGVTHIREMIGDNNILTWREEIQNGRLGPDMFVASPRIGSFDFLEGKFMSWSQGFLNISNATEAEQEVKRLHQEGYDGVKIYSHINQESYHAVCKTAKSLGMKVVGHVPWSIGLEDIYSNQHEVAHLEELMNALRREFGNYKSDTADEFLTFVEIRSNEVADELIKNDIIVTTTLWLVESFVRQKFELNKILKEVELEYENPGISEWTTNVPQGIGWLPIINRYKLPEGLTQEEKEGEKIFWETYAKACQVIVRNLSKKGVKIVAGTDANLPPTVPGFSLHDELISLNKTGISSSQVLNSVTAIPSDWLGNNGGKISIGKKANLVLLDKNPLDEISNTKKINSVILNGQLLDRQLLDEILLAVKDANDASRKIDISEFLD